MLEFVDGYWYFVAAGAIYLIILVIANLKKVEE